MSYRFFLPELLQADPANVRLEGAELHHLARVMRLEPGAQVRLFDGEGSEADATVLAVTKRNASLQLQEMRRDPPPVRGPIVLATAIPKADRFRWLVEKATELGVDELIPLHTARSVVDPREGKLDKMRQAVIEACKQSGRNRLMRLGTPTPFESVLTSATAAGSALLADPAGFPLPQSRAAERGRSLTIFIGPEGGWTPAELAAAEGAGAKLISLGPYILRMETAAIALAANFASARHCI